RMRCRSRLRRCSPSTNGGRGSPASATTSCPAHSTRDTGSGAPESRSLGTRCGSISCTSLRARPRRVSLAASARAIDGALPSCGRFEAMASNPPSGMTSGSSAANERELELLRLVVARDRAAFKELYLIYHRRLARFLMRMTSRHELIEEVINDTLWTVWQKAGEFRGASRVSTWIVGIAYRRALKSLRHASSHTSLGDGEPASADEYSRDEERQWIERALSELPFEQRCALELCYLLGHSCEEIAEIMNCPVNTVKTHMFHAREKLRRLLPRLAGASEP